VCRVGIRNGLDFLAINDPFIEPDYMVMYVVIVIDTNYSSSKMSLHRVH